MTTLEPTLLREISTLPESRLADVIAFVRFLKTSLPDKEKVRNDFKDALTETRSTAKKYQITQNDVDAEIRAVRDGE